MTSLCFAQATPEQKDPGHVMFTPQRIQWQAGPASLPAGAQIAVLDGDPAQAGVPYTIGLKMPDGYKIPPTGIRWMPVSPSCRGVS